MKDVAEEERRGLGLSPLDPLDPYALAREHGIPVYPIDELSDGVCSPEAVRHFTVTHDSTTKADTAARRRITATPPSPGRTPPGDPFR